MNEQQRAHFRRIGEWFAVEVELRASRKILATAGLALLALIAVAID
jgi:hypothetical protein